VLICVNITFLVMPVKKAFYDLEGNNKTFENK
jgi:hypothetical protein